MPFPQPHNLLAFGGPLFQGGEEWSCSLRSTEAGSAGEGSMEDAVVAVSDVLVAWFLSSGIVGSRAKLGWVKFNKVGADGKYVAGTTHFVDHAPPISPTGSSNHAPQVTLVATLETGLTRGLAHRGRMFLPAPAFNLETDGRLTAESALSASTAVAELITNLNGAPGYGTTIVASKTRAGDQRTVTGVTVGRVLDTMRSRRTSMPEDRTVVAPVGGF